MKEYIEFVCECGKLLKVPKERAGQTGKCSKCAKPVTIPFASSYSKEAGNKKMSPAMKEDPKYVPPVKQAVPVKKEAKKKESGSKSWKTILLVLIFFLLGIFLGIAIGPEYWNILPPKSKILWWKETIPEPIKTPPQEGNYKSSSESPKYHETKNRSQEIYDREKPKVEVAIRNIEAYVAVLDREILSLREKKNLLETRYSITTNEDVDKLLKESQQMKTGLEERLNYAKDSLQESKWDNLPQAYSYLKDYENLQADSSSLIKNLQKNSQKIEADLNRYQKHIASKPMIENSQYLGDWYDALKRNFSQWKSIRQTGQSTSGKSGILVQHIHQIIQRMETYPGEIQETSDTLLKIMNTKDVQRWIQYRKELSSSSSQKRQGLSVERFLQKDKKFELEVADELDLLRRQIISFQEKTERQETPDEVAGKILSALRIIERKYTEAYKDFNAGVIHFENHTF